MTKPENSEQESFLTRWSSRKLARRTPLARQDAEHAPRDVKPADENGEIEKARKDGDAPDNPPFDLAQLPPLDSIGPDTDITAFLRKEVPPELSRAALRRAWTSDPAIKDFVGLVENGWDFNDPSAMSGFGPISAEEVARLAGIVIEALPDAAPEDQTQIPSKGESESQRVSTDAPSAAPLEDTHKTAEPERSIGHDAAQQSEKSDKSSV